MSKFLVPKGTVTRGGVWLLAAAATWVVGVSACYPGDITDIEEADLVLTFYDTGAVFRAAMTYVMPDTIIRVTPDGPAADPPEMGDVDAIILDAIASEFAALGYERVQVGEEKDPDVVVLVTSASIDMPDWVPAGWWDYWGWWPGWGPGWGPCCFGPGDGPGYPWVGIPVTRTVGSLTIAMLDPSAQLNPTALLEENEIPAVWAGVLSGIFEGSEASSLDRVQGLIEQAFQQSPYLDGSGPSAKGPS